MKSPSLREIIAAFLHLGISAFGGLAMIEPVRRRVVEDKGWLSQTEFLDGLALCQMAPGATVVQLAAYAGYRLRDLRSLRTSPCPYPLPAPERLPLNHSLGDVTFLRLSHQFDSTPRC